MYQILILDDEQPIINAMARLIARIPAAIMNFPPTVHSFTDPEQAIASVRTQVYDLVISDFRMPQMDGLSFLREVVALQPDVARIIISGHADLPVVLSAVNALQIFRFVSKPWNDAELQQSIAQALHLRSLQQENQRLADVVRAQRTTLSRQQATLQQLERESPGITHVQRDADGAIVLDDD
jgi:two-component system probable response regulator PhcQ